VNQDLRRAGEVDVSGRDQQSRACSNRHRENRPIHLAAEISRSTFPCGIGDRAGDHKTKNNRDHINYFKSDQQTVASTCGDYP